MSNLGPSESSEYLALMARARDAERTGQLCWTAAGLVACVALSWAVAAKSPGLMLPVVFAVAFGFYTMVHSRRQTRMIAGYVEEFFENSGGGWFSRLRRLQRMPGALPSSEWVMACLSNALVACAVVFAWVYATPAARGELLAGVVTGLGVVFGFHSLSETASLQRTDDSALWRQSDSGPREVRRHAAAG